MDACDSVRRKQPLLGTFVEIAATGAAGGDLQQAVDDGFSAVAEVHRLMSFHDPESDVSRLNRDAFARAVPVHAWTYQVLETAIELNLLSAAEFRSAKDAEEIPSGPLIQSLPASSPINWKIELPGSPSRVVILETFPFLIRTRPPPRVAIQSVS